ncbi:hypothetical protein CEXT_732051 [Caerostris extrusa]|uniref:Uncharacterized protein n=1 Tax=Caerostris extrusa TaxID=172846 RepID=A0AAV4T7A8_CAEEX|nr:hypothetical protein CEXT_732051 [Caerostris extrusa]
MSTDLVNAFTDVRDAMEPTQWMPRDSGTRKDTFLPPRDESFVRKEETANDLYRNRLRNAGHLPHGRVEFSANRRERTCSYCGENGTEGGGARLRTCFEFGIVCFFPPLLLLQAARS